MIVSALRKIKLRAALPFVVSLFLYSMYPRFMAKHNRFFHCISLNVKLQLTITLLMIIYKRETWERQAPKDTGEARENL